MIEWQLEVVTVPVSDVDRAKQFYADQLSFALDLDHRIGDTIRIVQLTPVGSGCSIALGTGLGFDAMRPGSLQGLQLVVADIVATRETLVGRGVGISPIFHFEDGEQREGPGGPWNSFATFADPDGNGWTVQERPAATA